MPPIVRSISRRRFLATALLAALAPRVLRGQNHELQSILENIRRRARMPALAAAAIENGEIVEIGATGFRKFGDDEEVTMEDRWHVGSCTKSMTATLAAILIEQGKIDWATTIADVFPELRAVMDEDWQGVTLEQLLTHRAGAPGHAPDDLWMRAWQRRGTPTEQRLRYLGGLVTRAPEIPPGTKFLYSNQGYAVAGAMLERCGGQSWEEMMQTMLFQPLGMQHSGFGAPGNEKDVDQPWGHTGTGRKPEPVPPDTSADNPPSIGPAGTVHCSIGDLAKYCAFHAAEGQSGATLLTPASFKKLHTRCAPKVDYSPGWVVQERNWGGGDVLMHTGSNTMWYAAMWVAPAQNSAFVAATNIAHEHADDGCDEAIKTLVERLYGTGAD